MSEIVYKLNSPIKQDDKLYYPLTTYDQIILPNSNRWDGSCGNLDIDLSDFEEGNVNLNNADTLGGVPAQDFLLKTEIASDSDKIGGYDFNTLKSLMLDLAHPVGSYYWSSQSTNPSELFGGTWEQIKDQFILAAGDEYAVNATGGEKNHKLTVNELPKISGIICVGGGASGTTSGGYGAVRTASGVFSGAVEMQYGRPTAATSTAYSSDTSFRDVQMNFGNNEAHNNMPPYRVAYCWYRTA